MQERRDIKTSDGITLSVYLAGNPEKPALLFSNSLGTTHDMWAHQASALSEDFFTILYDTRGHGRSDAPAGAYSLDRLGLDVLEILDALSVERTYFCGLSLGGMTGQLLSVRASERLNACVLAATSAYMGPPSGWQARINTVLESGMAPIVDAVLERWFAPAGAASKADVDAVKAQLLATSPVGYAGCCAAIRDMDLRGLAGANGVSTLILAGDDDQATPPDHAQFLEQKINNSSLKRFRGGHLLNLEQPEPFTTSITEFFSAAVRAEKGS